MHKPIVTILILATAPAFAVDLSRAKLPLHYECKKALAAGIWRGNDGSWGSGRFETTSQLSRIELELISSASEHRAKFCRSESLRATRFNANGPTFCLTELTTIVQGMSPLESVYFCELAGPVGQSDDARIRCSNSGSIFFDTDRGDLVKTSGLFLFGAVSGEADASIQKFDCKRLDR